MILDKTNVEKMDESEFNVLFHFAGKLKVRNILIAFSKLDEFEKSKYYKNGSSFKGVSKKEPPEFLVEDFFKDVVVKDGAIGHGYAFEEFDKKFKKTLLSKFESLADKDDETIKKEFCSMLRPDSDDQEVKNLMTGIGEFGFAVLKTACGEPFDKEKLDELLKDNKKRMEEAKKEESKKKILERLEKEKAENESKTLKQITELKSKNSTLQSSVDKLEQSVKDLKEQLGETQKENDAARKELDSYKSKLSTLLKDVPEETEYAELSKVVDDIAKAVKENDYAETKRLAVALYTLAHFKEER